MRFTSVKACASPAFTSNASCNDLPVIPNYIKLCRLRGSAFGSEGLVP